MTENNARTKRNELAEAFIRGFQTGAEQPDDAGDGNAMYAAFRTWQTLESGSECTGVSATWCPVHGDCTCPDEHDEGDVGYGIKDLNDPGCSLHAPTSMHAETFDAPDPQIDGLRSEMLDAAAALDMIVQSGCDQAGNVRKVAEHLRSAANPVSVNVSQSTFSEV